MENYVDQIKNINIATFDVALCNGTIIEKLASLSDVQLEYLKSLIDVDEQYSENELLLDSVNCEIKRRNHEELRNTINDSNYPTTAQIETKVTGLIIERLENFDEEDMIFESLKELENYTLKNIKYYLSKKELNPKRIKIMDAIETELSKRQEEPNKKLSL